MKDLVSGWTAACIEARCAWGGGETQVLSGMIDPKVLVLGGSATGFVANERELLLGSRVTAGDVILFAPATGIHANGLSLARKVAETLPRGYETPVPGDPAGRAYGEVLLDPTPLYGVLLEALFDAGVEVHYAVNVTGHGFRKLMRSTNELSYVVRALPAVPPVLAMLAEAAAMSPTEAYGTFNMGAGFAFYVAPPSVDRALEVARAHGSSLLRAGSVEKGKRRVVLEPLGVTFEGETLGIR
jgi:phosphoribosylformylglycinamidine cyclo-ligase